MYDRIRFLLNRWSEKLWIRPLVMCLLSVAGALVASGADRLAIARLVPDLSLDSIETLLTNLSASMLVIATFTVGSMVASYSSASRTATPRSFPLILADDVSQNALAVFVGAFIFSVVALVAVKNGYYGKAGRFTLFVFTGLVFAAVVLTFVRWVDRIARLGRLSNTVEKIEKAAETALRIRRDTPRLGGTAPDPEQPAAWAVDASEVGYVQRIDMERLQAVAERADLKITVNALPGTFAAPGRPLAFVSDVRGDPAEIEPDELVGAFVIGRNRTFDEDPRFGLIALAEISSRALSPAVNDPGTAIAVIGALVRLLVMWGASSESTEVRFDRVAVPALSLDDMFDDAFRSTARDGAACIEVAMRLQKAFGALAIANDGRMESVAKSHAEQAYERARAANMLPGELKALAGTRLLQT